MILEAGHDAARSERFVVTMPDGVTLDAVAMEHPIDHLRANGGHAPELP